MKKTNGQNMLHTTAVNVKNVPVVSINVNYLHLNWMLKQAKLHIINVIISNNVAFTGKKSNANLHN